MNRSERDGISPIKFKAARTRLTDPFVAVAVAVAVAYFMYGERS